VTAADIAALPELQSVGVGGDVQYFTNSLDTKTTGVDLIGTWRSELGAGGLNLTLAYNYNKNEVTKFDPAAIGPAQIKTAELLAPNHRANLQAGWTLNNFGVNLVERYYSTWSAEADYPGQVFGAKYTTDLDFRYTFFEKYTLTAGASNLFDERPDKIKQSATNPVFPIVGGLADGQVYPRNGGPFGINGTFWYASLRINFD